MSEVRVCGCATISTGVICIAVAHLAVNVTCIALASSKDSYNLGGVVLTPFIQCVNAAICLLGIPIIMNAIVGMLYYIESNIRLYNLYLVVCMITTIVHVVLFGASGSVCNQDKSNPKFQHNFACAFTDFFVIFFGCVWVLFMLYFIWVVKQAQVLIRLSVPPVKASHIEKISDIAHLAPYGSTSSM